MISTELTAAPGQIIERYAARWSIEVEIEDAEQPQASGRPATGCRPRPNAPVPFTLIVTSLAICWYAVTGYQPSDVTAARDLAPRTATRPGPRSQT